MVQSAPQVAEEVEIKLGDVVTLNSGGPLLTVTLVPAVGERYYAPTYWSEILGTFATVLAPRYCFSLAKQGKKK